ncbi:MAG: ATP-grasp domain-containing protein [Gemella sp.]|nr:ATP-grasp domain-containing protein [Gemella sp.]
MNYIMISPYFPKNLQNFAIKLKENGVNVLGIGSEPYENLTSELRESLTEYYRVEDMESFEQMTRAVAFLFFKHGKIDRLESNNEHWLEMDAKLREQFNIDGLKPKDLEKTKYKSEMKKLFQKAGIPVVKGAVIKSEKDLEKALKDLRLPLVAKPDKGVGAAKTFKLYSLGDVARFKSEWDKEVPYFVEPYVEDAILCTYDGLLDQEGNIIFSSSLAHTIPTLELVLNKEDLVYIIEPKVDSKLEKYGKKIVKAFDMKERFFHIEFFRLKDGSYYAIEYNNRIAGGYATDLYNYSASCDLYEMYAKVVAGNLPEKVKTDKKFAVGIARRDTNTYKNSPAEIQANFDVKMYDRVPEILSSIMGDEIFAVVADSEKEIQRIIDFVQEK